MSVPGEVAALREALTLTLTLGQAGPAAHPAPAAAQVRGSAGLAAHCQRSRAQWGRVGGGGR